jgi:chromosome partitioning protein
VLTYDPGSSGALSYLEAAREMALRGVGGTAGTAQAAPPGGHPAPHAQQHVGGNK